MRIKRDENLPRRLAPRLRDLGHDVHTPDDEGLRGAEDGSIWEATQREQRFLITQDLDFPTCGGLRQEVTKESYWSGCSSRSVAY